MSAVERGASKRWCMCVAKHAPSRSIETQPLKGCFLHPFSKLENLTKSCMAKNSPMTFLQCGVSQFPLWRCMAKNSPMTFLQCGVSQFPLWRCMAKNSPVTNERFLRRNMIERRGFDREVPIGSHIHPIGVRKRYLHRVGK